jgi:hypothetical protein
MVRDDAVRGILRSFGVPLMALDTVVAVAKLVQSLLYLLELMNIL